jgi:hypothetical protein
MKKIILSAVISSLGLMACTPPIIPDTNVRFVNTVADSGGLKIFIKGERENIGSLLAFKQALPSLTGYKTLKAGTLTYSLCPDNSQDCPIAVKDKTVVLDGLEKKSIYLVGTTTPSDDTPGADARPLEIVVLKDEAAAPVVGKAMIRVLHTANLPSAKTLGVHITTPDAPLLVLPSNLNYKANTEYVALDAGTWRIRGTVAANTIVDSATLTLEGDKTYTAMLVNDAVVLLTDK